MNPQKLQSPHTVRVLITAIAGGATDASAAREVGIDRKTLRRHRDRNPAFDLLYRRADARRRGVEFVESPPLTPPPPEPPPPPPPPPPEPPPPRPLTPEAETEADGAAFAAVVVNPNEVVDCEVVVPSPGLVDLADTHIEAVERHLPTGKLENGKVIGVRELVAKNLSLVDEDEAPPALRTEALRTLNKLYLAPVLDLLMADLTRPPIETTATAEKPKREPGLSKDVVRQLTNAIAGPPVEA